MKAIRILLLMLAFCFITSSPLSAQRFIRQGLRALGSASRASTSSIKGVSQSGIYLRSGVTGWHVMRPNVSNLYPALILKEANDARKKSRETLDAVKIPTEISINSLTECNPLEPPKPQKQSDSSKRKRQSAHKKVRDIPKSPFLRLEESLNKLTNRKGLPRSRDSLRAMAERAYPEVKAVIERGECDSMPAKLIWAGNYALAKGDTLFSNLCFEKAKSPYLSIWVMRKSIYGGMSHTRHKIPELLQYMAEQNFLLMVDSTACVPDSIRKFTTAAMTELAERYCQPLLPLTRLYYCAEMPAQEANKELHDAIMLYADSTLTYSDLTLRHLLNTYVWHSRGFAESCSNLHSEPLLRYIYDCLELCRKPRLKHYVEDDFFNTVLLADICGILGLEEDCRHYLNLSARSDPEQYGEEATVILNNIIFYYRANLDATTEVNRARFRMITESSPDAYESGLNLIEGEHLSIMDHFIGSGGAFLSKHMQTDCELCRGKARTIVASIEELRKIAPDAGLPLREEMWLDLYENYYGFVTDPQQTDAVGAVEQILERAKKTDMPLKDDLVLETANALADMKMQTGANPKELVGMMKSFERKVKGKKLDMTNITHHIFYEYITLLCKAAGDEKKSARYGETAKKLEEYRNNLIEM